MFLKAFVYFADQVLAQTAIRFCQSVSWKRPVKVFGGNPTNRLLPEKKLPSSKYDNTPAILFDDGKNQVHLYNFFPTDTLFRQERKPPLYLYLMRNACNEHNDSAQLDTMLKELFVCEKVESQCKSKLGQSVYKKSDQFIAVKNQRTFCGAIGEVLSASSTTLTWPTSCRSQIHHRNG